MNKKIILGIFATTILLIIFFGTSKKEQTLPYVYIAGQSVKVDLAVTKETQEKGLSGRSGLHEGEGMFFVFDKIGRYDFWMKDMLFPIDIIWLDADKKVVYIEKNVTNTSPFKIYGPSFDTKYVLEVPAGFSDKYGLKVGDSADLEEAAL